MGGDGRDSADIRTGASEATQSPRVEFQDVIGRELRNLYDDVAAQPVPDRFLNLLNQLEDNLLNSAGTRDAPGESE